MKTALRFALTLTLALVATVASAQKLGMTRDQYGEILAVVGLFNQMNKLADSFQVEPDILPKLEAW